MSDVKHLPEKRVLEDIFPLSGNLVFWFQEGDHGNIPCPAIVNMDSTGPRSLSLTVFTVNGPSVRDGVKHVDAKASVIDRRDNGGWAWNRKPEKKVEEQIDKR